MPQRILVVDDNTTTRSDMIRILKASDPLIEVSEARDGIEALKILGESSVDLIIADLVMPRMDGIKLLSAVRQDERLQDTPVVIVTAKSHVEEKLLSFEHGAQDFLTKPYHAAELVARTRVMLRLRAQMRAIEQRAVLDGLTGLYNQNYLTGALTRELKRCQRHGLTLSCLMIDVDDFKAINDTHGHLAGDAVLRAIGNMLQTTLRGYDFAVRYGGDEFLVILAQNTASGAIHLAERLREMVSQHAFFPNQRGAAPITVSIGVASRQGSAVESPAELIEVADQALYQAKTDGKNRVVVTASPASAA